MKKKEEIGYTIMTDNGDFLIEPIQLFDKRSEALFVAKQTAKDIGDNWKTYKIVKAKISII